MPHGITQYYLPPGRGDIPAFTPAEASTRLSDPGGMQGWVDLECVTNVCMYVCWIQLWALQKWLNKSVTVHRWGPDPRGMGNFWGARGPVMQSFVEVLWLPICIHEPFAISRLNSNVVRWAKPIQSHLQFGVWADADDVEHLLLAPNIVPDSIRLSDMFYSFRQHLTILFFQQLSTPLAYILTHSRILFHHCKAKLCLMGHVSLLTHAPI